MSRVNSSRPSLVSRISAVYSSMWIRREGVVLHQSLVDDDGVLEVVAVEGHERDQRVATEGEFALVRRRAVGHDLALLDLLALLDDGLLVLAGPLVEAAELAENVLVGVVHQDALGVDVSDRARPLGADDHAAVLRDVPLHPRRHARRVGAEQRHGLPLHVAAHQGAVGVVVLQERDQRGTDRNGLLRRDVDVLDRVAARRGQIALHAGELQPLVHVAVAAHDVRRREDRLHFFVGAKVLRRAVDFAVLDDAVRRDEEAVLVDVGVDRQRRDQADVRAFRRLNWADSPVVADVNVAHLEAGALAVEAARSERGKPTLVGELRQRVGLVDDLRKLAAAEEEVDRATDRFGVHQVRHLAEFVRILQAHALLHGALELQEALANLLRRQLVDEPQAAVAEVVDVVDVPLAVPQGEHVPQRVHEVLAPQDHLRLRHVLLELAVDAEPPDPAQAVALLVEELLVEQRPRLLNLRRVAGAKPAVNLENGLLVAVGDVLRQRVEDQRVADLRHDRNLIDVARLKLLDVFAELRAGLDHLLARLGVDDARRRVVLGLEVLGLTCETS